MKLNHKNGLIMSCSVCLDPTNKITIYHEDHTSHEVEIHEGCLHDYVIERFRTDQPLNCPSTCGKVIALNFALTAALDPKKNLNRIWKWFGDQLNPPQNRRLRLAALATGFFTGFISAASIKIQGHIPPKCPGSLRCFTYSEPGPLLKAVHKLFIDIPVKYLIGGGVGAYSGSIIERLREPTADNALLAISAIAGATLGIMAESFYIDLNPINI